MALHRIAWNGLWNANCSVLGRVVVPRKVSDYNAQRRVLSTDREKEALKGLSVEEILALPSNRATRYVYLRTIPLAAQSEYSNPSGNDNTMVGEAVSAIESQTSRVIAKHAGSKVVDLRSAVHLHTAALALSTYRVCAPTVGTERSVGLIRKAFGIGQSLPAHWITKTALLFTPNRLNAARRMMDNTVQDFGEAFDARVVEADTDEDTVQLVISKYPLIYMSRYVPWYIYRIKVDILYQL